jgi:hypothetical protein
MQERERERERENLKRLVDLREEIGGVVGQEAEEC